MSKKEDNTKEILEELQKDVLNPDLIQDNKLHFYCENHFYRVRMPNQKEQNDATNKKNQSFIKLLQEENTVTVDQLKDILKKKNIDIDKIDDELQSSEKEMMNIYISLNKKRDEENEEIKKYKDELNNIRIKRMDLVMKKANLLAPAIEYQAQDEYYRYLSAHCTEKFIKPEKSGDVEKWERVWENYENFLEDRSKLRMISIGKFTELLFAV